MKTSFSWQVTRKTMVSRKTRGSRRPQSRKGCVSVGILYLQPSLFAANTEACCFPKLHVAMLQPRHTSHVCARKSLRRVCHTY